MIAAAKNPTPVQGAARARYGLVQIALHWLVVALIVEQYVTSAAILRTHSYHRLGKPPDPFDLTLHTVHTRVGLAIFALMTARLVLRLTCGAPPWKPPLPAWRARLSVAVHHALYLVLLIEAVAGAVASYLWWPMSVVHKALFWALLGLVALHLGGAALSFASRPRETLYRITGVLTPMRQSTQQGGAS